MIRTIWDDLKVRGIYKQLEKEGSENYELREILKDLFWEQGEEHLWKIQNWMQQETIYPILITRKNIRKLYRPRDLKTGDLNYRVNFFHFCGLWDLYITTLDPEVRPCYVPREVWTGINVSRLDRMGRWQKHDNMVVNHPDLRVFEQTFFSQISEYIFLARPDPMRKKWLSGEIQN